MEDTGYINFDEASEFLGIPKKYLENYVKVGNEINQVKVGRRKLLSKSDLQNWKIQKEFNSVILNKEDYIKCLEFSINSFYSYRSTSDFGTSQQRDAGKFVSNFVIGKLGEIALSKFLVKNFNVFVKLDFELRDAVVGQDITEIAFPRKNIRVYNPIKKRIAIKTSKMKNVWLIVSKNEVDDVSRYSDVYIFTRIDLYLDHLIRLLKDHEALSNLHDIIPPFKEIEAEVCGFAFVSHLKNNAPVTKLPKPNQDIQLSYILRTGDLKKDVKSWELLLEQL